MCPAVVRVPSAPAPSLAGVVQGLERACAEHEDVRALDPVLRVQDEVDEVRDFPSCTRGVIRTNVRAEGYFSDRAVWESMRGHTA